MMFGSFLAPPRPARASPKKISPFRKSTLSLAGDKSKCDPYNFRSLVKKINAVMFCLHHIHYLSKSTIPAYSSSTYVV